MLFNIPFWFLYLKKLFLFILSVRVVPLTTVCSLTYHRLLRINFIPLKVLHLLSFPHPVLSLYIYYKLCMLMLIRFSHIWLYATLWIAAHQVPLSTGFSSQECWSGLPFLSPISCAVHFYNLCFRLPVVFWRD